MKCRVLVFVLATTNIVSGLHGAGNVEPTLRDTARHSGFLISTAVRPSHLLEPLYASTLALEFNMLEPEDALKWETVHPQRESYNFVEGDKAVDFAIRHDMKVRGHTLVWHQQNPTWLTDGTFTPAELTAILESHIETVVRHYRGKIFAWDVVNEAFDERVPGALRSTIWSVVTNMGSAANESPSSKLVSDGKKRPYSYIENCFRWAHAADPKALLFYNDAGAEGLNPKSDAIYAMVRDFRQRGVPIDGVGFQMHIANMYVDVGSVSANIERFAALGVQVHITELDVALPVDADGDPRPEDLQRQADIYRQVATICISDPGCTAIQTWGFTDKYSWIGSHSKQKQGAALLFDRRYERKPAYEALRKVLEQASLR